MHVHISVMLLLFRYLHRDCAIFFDSFVLVSFGSLLESPLSLPVHLGATATGPDLVGAAGSVYSGVGPTSGRG